MAELAHDGLEVMASFTLIRLAGIAATGALMAAFDVTEYVSLVLCVALGHYFLALVYSRKQIVKNVSDDHPRYWLLSLLVVTGVVCYYRQPAILFVFGLHHILSETYMTNRGRDGLDAEQTGTLNSSRLLLSAFVYLAILRNSVPLPNLVIAGGLALSVAFFALMIFRHRGVLDGEWLRGCLSFEAAGLLVVGLSIPFDIGFIDIVLYHFLLWIVPPTFGLAQGGVRALSRYAVLTASVTGAFFLLSPAAGFDFSFSVPESMGQIELWGYVHIFLSLAVSSLNPEWVNRLAWKQVPA